MQAAGKIGGGGQDCFFYSSAIILKEGFLRYIFNYG